MIPSWLKTKCEKTINLLTELINSHASVLLFSESACEKILIHSEKNPLKQYSVSLCFDFFCNKDNSHDEEYNLNKFIFHTINFKSGNEVVNGILILTSEKKRNFSQKQKKVGEHFAQLINNDIDIIHKTDNFNKKYHLDKIVYNAKDVIYRMLLPSGKYEYISPAIYQISGYRDKDFYEDSSLIFKIAHPDWKGYIKDRMDDLLNGIAPDFYEYQIINRIGEARWINQRNVLIKDEEGRPIAIEGIARDFTENKHKEQINHIQKELSVSISNKKTLSEIIDDTLKGITKISGIDCGRVYIYDESKGRIKLFDHIGLTEEFINLITDDDLGIHTDIILKGESFFGSCRLFPDYEKVFGKEGLKAIAVIPIVTSRKKIQGYFSISSHTIEEIPKYIREALETIVWYTSNAIERAQSDYELEQSEERYRLIVENSDSVIWTADESGKLLFVSSNIEKITGYTPDNVENFKTEFWRALAHSSELPGLLEAFEKLVTKKTPYQLDFRAMKKNGQLIWLRNKAHIFEETDRTFLFGTLTDITNLKQVQSDLKKERDNARNYFNIAGVILISLNSQGKIEAINKKGCEILGGQESEIIGKSWFDNYLPVSVRENALAVFKEIAAGKLTFNYYENSIVNSKGEERLIAWNNTIIRDPDGNFIGTLSSGEDITERKQNQQKLFNAVIHAEEEERSRIAKDLHDGVSPVLSTLKLYVQSLNMTNDDKLKGSLMSRIGDTINETISSIKEISNNLSPHILHNFGYVTAIQSFINRLKDIKHVNFEFESNYEGRFDEKVEITLYRVTIELINNTLKHANAKKILIRFNKNSNFVVHYEDDGTGFDPEKVVIETKGMGFYNMRNRIESLNGEIKVCSRNGLGTTVDIIIPVNV